MPVNTAVNSETFQVTTPSDREIRLTRLFSAPRQLVFDAMTRAEHVREWWGRLGDGYAVPVCEIDLRVGGAWRFVNRHPKGEAVFYGEYREITPPSRLVFTEIFAPFPQSVSVVTSDFTEEGRKAGRWLLENYKGQGDVNIVELQGTVGSAPAIDRKKGFEEVIKTQPRFKIIRSQTGDFTRAKGKEVMEAFLKAEGKKINVLYAHNDDMAIGAIQAIEEAGMQPGKDIYIISIDAVKGAFQAMMNGKLNVSVECSPLLGPQLMQAVKDLKAGKTLPRRIVTEEGVFPMETAAKEFPNRKY